MLISRVLLTETGHQYDDATLAQFKVEDERPLEAARGEFGRVCDQVEWLTDQILGRHSEAKSLGVLASAHWECTVARIRLDSQLNADWDTALTREDAVERFDSMHGATRALRKSVRDLARRPLPRRPGVMRRSKDWVSAKREGWIYRRNKGRAGEPDTDPTSQLEAEI